MKKLISILGLLLLFIPLLWLSGCEGGSVPNLYATQGSLQAARKEVDAAILATQDARVAAQEEMARKSFSATMAAAETRSAAEVEKGLLAARITSTVEALRIQATADANSISRVATADTYRMIATVDAAGAQATLVAIDNQRRLSEIDLQTRLLMNKVWAVSIWVFSVAIILLICYVLIKVFNAKANKNASFIYADPNGKYPLLRDGTKIVDVGRSMYPVVDYRNPHFPSDDLQYRVTESAQKIDLARNLPGAYSPPLIEDKPRFQMIPPGERPPQHLLPDDLDNILEADWTDE